MGKLAEKFRKIFLISARSDELNFFGKMKIRPIGLRLKFFFEIFLPVFPFLILASRQGVVGIYTTSPNGQIFTFTSPVFCLPYLELCETGKKLIFGEESKTPTKSPVAQNSTSRQHRGHAPGSGPKQNVFITQPLLCPLAGSLSSTKGSSFTEPQLWSRSYWLATQRNNVCGTGTLKRPVPCTPRRRTSRARAANRPCAGLPRN